MSKPRRDQVLSCRFTDDEHRRLVALAKRKGLTASELVRALVAGELAGPAPTCGETVNGWWEHHKGRQVVWHACGDTVADSTITVTFPQPEAA